MRSASVLQILVFVWAAAWLCAQPRPPATTGTISGRVLDGEGLPFAGQPVTFLPGPQIVDGPRAITITTDSQGNYRYGDLPPGPYTVRYSRDNDVRHQVRDVTVVAGGTAVVNFDLRQFPMPGPRSLLNVFSNRIEIAPDGWFAWYGTNLAAVTREWASGDFAGGTPPSRLGDVEIIFNGRAVSAISYVSPQQINFFSATGGLFVVGTDAVELCVRRLAPGVECLGLLVGGRPCSRETCTIVPFRHFSPALYTSPFFLFQGRQYVGAFSDDFRSFVGNPGPQARPARPGETIVLFGIGFGHTYPPTNFRNVIETSAPLLEPVELRIGGRWADDPPHLVGGIAAGIRFAGTVSQTVGLYQLNAVVPQLPDGDHPVWFRISEEVSEGDRELGPFTQTGLYLAIRR